MGNIGKIMFGENYSDKMKLFDASMVDIINNYKGDFDVKANFYTISTQPNEQKVYLSFDKDKETPIELKEKIEGIFHLIWQ